MVVVVRVFHLYWSLSRLQFEWHGKMDVSGYCSLSRVPVSEAVISVLCVMAVRQGKPLAWGIPPMEYLEDSATMTQLFRLKDYIDRRIKCGKVLFSFDAPPRDDVLRVAVEGNIGCGKSTLLVKYLEGLPPAVCVEEPVSAWRDVGGFGINLLDLFYKDKPKYAALLQTHVRRLWLHETGEYLEEIEEQYAEWFGATSGGGEVGGETCEEWGRLLLLGDAGFRRLRGKPFLILDPMDGSPGDIAEIRAKATRFCKAVKREKLFAAIAPPGGTVMAVGGGHGTRSGSSSAYLGIHLP